MVLIDAHAVLHRAFHALPNFTSSAGEPTGALYGFSAFLIKIIKELQPDYIAACYDLPQPTFRHVAYEKYKAQRPKTDDILAKQINRSRDILKAFEVPVYDSPSFEADDILGTIVGKLKTQKENIVIDGVEHKFGSSNVTGSARIYSSIESLKKIEKKAILKRHGMFEEKKEEKKKEGK